LQASKFYSHRFRNVIFAIFLVATFSACRKKDQPENLRPSPDTLPAIETTNGAKVFGSTVIMSATVISVGGSSIISEGICVDTLPGPTIYKSQIQAKDMSRIFTVKTDGLLIGRKYFARAFATSAAGVAYSGEISFVIPDITSEALLTWRDFVTTSFVVDPAINGSNDVWQSERPCEKDNILRFVNNGIAEFDEGAVKCDPIHPQKTLGSWSVSPIVNVLTIKDKDSNATKCSLLVNDGQSLVLGLSEAGPLPHSYTITMLKH
jgi:hypothetical protein